MPRKKIAAKKRTATKSELTEKQLLFCREYIKDLNTSQAAVRAGYRESSAKAHGHELLQKPAIKREINRVLECRSQRLKMDGDYILSEIHDTYQEAREEGDIKSALKALELLGKHLKLFTETQEIKHTGEVQMGFMVVPAKGALPDPKIVNERIIEQDG